MLVCAGDEKGFREHFGGGRGLSIVSVRVKSQPGERKDTATDQTPRTEYQQEEAGEPSAPFSNRPAVLTSV